MAERKESAPKSCCRHMRNFFSLTPKGAEPVNYTILFTVVIALFGSAYSITFLFPFLPDMVLVFGYAEEDKGYYAGYIASGMFAGRVFGSFFWGWMSDRFGRRPIMLLTTIAVGLTNIAFGFSHNLYMAVATRFVNGIFNGLVGTSKTILYEISDNTNQAVGMSAIAMAWGSGVVLGPLISGFLAQPAKKYPAVFPEGSLFHTFPFLLPSIIAFFMCVIGFFAVLWKLPETLARKSGESKEANEVAESLLERTKESQSVVSKPAEEPHVGSVSVEVTTAKSKAASCLDIHQQDLNTESHHPEECACTLHKRKLSKSLNYLHASAMYEDASDIYGLGQPLTASQQILRQSQHSLKHPTITISLSNGSLKPSNGTADASSCRMTVVKTLSNSSGSVAEAQESKAVCLDDGHSKIELETPPGDETSQRNCCYGVKKMTLCRLLRRRDVLVSVMLYSTLSFAVVGFEELFIVWASTETRLGGLGLSAGKIGAAVGGSSTGLLLIQIFIYPKLVNKFGTTRVMQTCLIYLIVVTCIIPCLRFLDNESVALWVLMLTMIGLQKLAVTSCFSSACIFVNNSVLPCDAGSVNGIGMTASALLRTAAPCIAGSMFAWSITEGVTIGFPLDVNMAFIFLSIVMLGIAICSAFLPKSLEKQKKPQDV